MRDVEADPCGDDHWLLSLAAEHRFPMGHLLHARVHDITNQRPRHMAPVAVAAALARTVERGHAEVLYRSSPGSTRHRVVRDPAAAVRIAEEECKDYDTFGPARRSALRLTAAGTRVWESFTQPDWSKFLDVRETLFDGRCSLLTVRCQDRTWLERYLDIWRRWRGIDSLAVIRRTRRWRATYWKSLRDGHVARLTLRECDKRTADQSVGFAINFFHSFWRTLV